MEQNTKLALQFLSQDPEMIRIAKNPRFPFGGRVYAFKYKIESEAQDLNIDIEKVEWNEVINELKKIN